MGAIETVRPANELLPWLLPLTDSTVVCKDSMLLASFSLKGIDADSVSKEEMESACDMLDLGMRPLLMKPATVWWTVHRRRTWVYPDASFPDPISARVDAIRREAFLSGQNFVNSHYLSIGLSPPQGTARYFDRLRAFLADGENPLKASVLAFQTLFSGAQSFAWAAEEMSSVLKGFDNLLDEVKDPLRNLALKRITGGDLFGFLRSCCSPASESAPVLPHAGWSLDSFLSETAVDVGGSLLKMTGGERPHFVGAVSIKGWPSHSVPGMLDSLMSVPGEITLSHTFRVVDRDAADKHIRSVRRFNDILKYGIKTYIGAAMGQGFNEDRADPARKKAADDATLALGELTNSSNFYGWHNFTVLCHGETAEEAENLTKEVMARSRYVGFAVVRETTHLLSAFEATIPGSYRDTQRWAFMGARNLSDIAPIRGVLSGERKASYLSNQTRRDLPALSVLTTESKTPFYFNFHCGDVGHTFVAGPTRAGKTTAMNFLLSQWRKYDPCRVIIFDKDYSCKIPTILQGGAHIDLVGDGANVKLNPFTLIDNKEDWGFLVRWLEVLITSRGYVMTSEDEKSLLHALEAVHESAPENRRLMTVRTQLSGELGEQLDAWVGDKPLGQMFDNVEDSFAISNMVCIEMGEIMSDKRAARAFMDYAFHRIRRALEKNREAGNMCPTVIYVEECWFLLEDESFAAKIRDWLKTLAKLCANLVLTTQSMEDLAKSTVFPSIRDNVPTRLFLPNPAAKNDTLYGLYRGQFELADRQIDLIRTGVAKRDFLLVQPGIARMVSLPLNAESVAMLRSDAAAQKVFGKWYGSGDPEWKTKYIEEVQHV